MGRQGTPWWGEGGTVHLAWGGSVIAGALALIPSLPRQMLPSLVEVGIQPDIARLQGPDDVHQGSEKRLHLIIQAVLSTQYFDQRGHLW